MDLVLLLSYIGEGKFTLTRGKLHIMREIRKFYVKKFRGVIPKRSFETKL